MALQLPQEEGITASQTFCALGVAAPVSAVLGVTFSSYVSSSSVFCGCCPSSDTQVINIELTVINVNSLMVI